MLTKLKTHHGIHATLKQQIHNTVLHLFLNILKDDLMRYSYVDAIDMLDHLKNKYAVIISDNIKGNSATLLRLMIASQPSTANQFGCQYRQQAQNLQCSCYFITMAMFEKEQLFVSYCNTWCNCDKDKHMLEMFKGTF